jgi:phosphoglycerate dehydrogenase-like enzyme
MTDPVQPFDCSLDLISLNMSAHSPLGISGNLVLSRLSFLFLQIVNGEWNVAAVGHKARDLERKVVGTLGFGRIGQEMAKRLQVNALAV